MERFIRKFWSLMLVGIVVMGTSCTKNGEDLGDGDEEIVTVALSLGGELRETQTPMMSANRVGEENNDLYGIQINVGNMWDAYYAWGIFDDLTGVTVDLAPSKTYSIIVTYIPDGKNFVYNYGDDTNVCYEIPFNTYGWSKTTMNKFNYTSSEFLHALNLPQVYVMWEDGKYIPLARQGDRGKHNAIDFYHGELCDYIPTEDGKLVVDMKRYVCALEFVAKAVEGYNYDKILIQLDAENILDQVPKPYYMTKQSDGTYSTVDLPLIMMNSLAEEDKMTISIGTDEPPEENFNGVITLKRLVKHTFEFDAMPAEDKITNGVEINKEDTDFTNETSSL